MIKIKLTKSSILEQKTDLLVVGFYKNSNKPEGLLAELDNLLEGAILDLIQQGDITGKHQEVTILHTFGKLPAKRLLVIGLGEEAKFDHQQLREAAGTVVKTGLKLKVKKICSVLLGLNNPNIHEHHLTHSFAEGAYLADYHFVGYNSEKEKREEIEQIDLFADKITEEMQFGLECGTAYALGTNFARDLTNTPANMLTPTQMAEKAMRLLNASGWSMRFWRRQRCNA